MKIEIRPITKENESILALPNDPFLEEGRVVPLYDGKVWSCRIEMYQKEWIRETRFPDGHYRLEEMGEGFTGLAAYADGVPAGFALLFEKRDRWLFLDNLLVTGEYRRKGVGTALVNAAMELAEQKGKRGIRLVCQDTNLPAVRFYFRNGFTFGGMDLAPYEGTKRADMADLFLYKRKKHKIAFLFSGQGAQYPGMMRELAEEYGTARAVFDAAGRALGRDVAAICFDGDCRDLELTHNTQPCVLAADLAAYEALMANGVKPDAVAGFPLGEYAALVAAGAMRTEDAFPVVQKRADAMQDAVPAGKGAMAAVIKMPREELETLLKRVGGYITIANYNSPIQVVLSGENDAIDAVCAACEGRYRAVKLQVSAPFHCAMMKPAADVIRDALEDVPFQTPNCPVYMNVDAKPETDGGQMKEKLVRQAKSPVYWQQTIEQMAQDGIDTFIELGPGHTLRKLVRQIIPGALSLQVEDRETLAETLAALAPCRLPE